MSLADLLETGRIKKLATAIPATGATEAAENSKIAEIAVADSKNAVSRPDTDSSKIAEIAVAEARNQDSEPDTGSSKIAEIAVAGPKNADSEPDTGSGKIAEIAVAEARNQDSEKSAFQRAATAISAIPATEGNAANEPAPRGCCVDCRHFESGRAELADGSTIATPGGLGTCAVDVPAERYVAFLDALDHWERRGRPGAGPQPESALWPAVERACACFEVAA